MSDERRRKPFRAVDLLGDSSLAGFTNLQFIAAKLIGRNVLSTRMISPAKNCVILIIAIIVQLKLGTLILPSNCRGFTSWVCASDLCGPCLAKMFYSQLCWNRMLLNSIGHVT